jgi:hypothetical protein
MIELISNNAHNSEVYVYLNEDNSGKRTARKVAMSEHGISALRREYAGWSWYSGRRYSSGNAPANRLIVKPGCITWELDWLPGNCPRLDKGLGPNRIALNQAIDHYISIWPIGKKSVPMHGDYSLVNLLLGPHGTHVLDWECFNENGPPWGFDALHILFETLWYTREKHGTISKRDYSIIVQCLQKLSSKGNLFGDFLTHPLGNVRLWIAQFPVILNNRSFQPPVLQFSDDEAKEIDDQIQYKLKHGL